MDDAKNILQAQAIRHKAYVAAVEAEKRNKGRCVAVAEKDCFGRSRDRMPRIDGAGRPKYEWQDKPAGGWRIGFGISNVLVAEGAGGSRAIGFRLFKALQRGERIENVNFPNRY